MNQAMELETTSGPAFSVSALEKSVDAVLQHNFDAVSKPCLITTMKLLDNCIQKPDKAQFRTIKLSNSAIQSKIGNCKGGVEFLESIGFRPNRSSVDGAAILTLDPNTTTEKQLITARRLLMTRCIRELGLTADELPKYKPPPKPVELTTSTGATTAFSAQSLSSNTFNPYQGLRFDGQSAAVGANLGPDANYQSTTEAELAQLRQAQAKLERKLQGGTNTIPHKRHWSALRPGQSRVTSSSATTTTHTANNTTRSSSSTAGDAGLLALRAQKQQEERLAREQGGFTTLAMRDLAKLKKQKVYASTQLHLHFPDGTRLSSGDFRPKDTIQAVHDAVRDECLRPEVVPADFELYVTPPRRRLEMTASLSEEGLVPAAKIFVSWKVPLTTSTFIQSHLFEQAPTQSFPLSHSVVGSDTSATSAAAAGTGSSTAGSKKKQRGTREDEMLQRMMGGGKGGLGGAKKSSSSGKSNNSSNSKPKWFKG